jgi:hypothetical protein
MKFVSLGKFDKPFRAALESLPKSIAMSHQIHTYTELRQQIHDDLRIQHPEWVEQMANPPCGSWKCSTTEFCYITRVRARVRNHNYSQLTKGRLAGFGKAFARGLFDESTPEAQRLANAEVQTQMANVKQTFGSIVAGNGRCR